MTTIYVNLLKTPGGNYVIAPLNDNGRKNVSVFKFALTDKQSKELEDVLNHHRQVCRELATTAGGDSSKFVYANFMRDSLSMTHLSIKTLAMEEYPNHKVTLVFPSYDKQHTWELGTLKDVLSPNLDVYNVVASDADMWPDAPHDPLPWED